MKSTVPLSQSQAIQSRLLLRNTNGKASPKNGIENGISHASSTIEVDLKIRANGIHQTKIEGKRGVTKFWYVAKGFRKNRKLIIQ